MKLPLYIAGRYLFARKSHNVINVISGISAAGMALGTAALVLIMSVFNGFNGIIRDNLSATEADLRVVPAQGKAFVPEGPAFDAIYDAPQAGSICSIISDKVFVSYEGRQCVAEAIGADEVYAEELGLELHRGGDGAVLAHREDIGVEGDGALCGLVRVRGHEAARPGVGGRVRRHRRRRGVSVLDRAVDRLRRGQQALSHLPHL